MSFAVYFKNTAKTFKQATNEVHRQISNNIQFKVRQGVFLDFNLRRNTSHLTYLNFLINVKRVFLFFSI